MKRKVWIGRDTQTHGDNFYVLSLYRSSMKKNSMGDFPPQGKRLVNICSCMMHRMGIRLENGQLAECEVVLRIVKKH